MKKHNRHLKNNISSRKKFIFTSIAVTLTVGVSIGSYLAFNFKKNESCIQEQSATPNTNESKDDSETVSVLKVKSSDNNDGITNSLSSNTNFELWNKTCEPNLIVVNKDNPLPKDFQSNIVDFKEVQVSNIMKDNLYKMINDASREGINLWISSAYRNIEKQRSLYNKEVEHQKKNANTLEEAKRLAANVVAEPGRSEHNTGLAVDFNGVQDSFFKSKEYNWLEKNSANYGFILRYKKEKSHITNVIFEPWHFRYVGEKHAKIMNEKDLCLEEYINSIK